MEVVQTPSGKDSTLIEHYVGIIENRLNDIFSYTKYLAADGYFMKKNFIDPLIGKRLNIITKMLHDANLQYLYHGKQREGKGRKKKFAGKVDVKNIDKSLWSLCLENDEIIAYEQILYCVTLKRVAKVVYM